MTEDVSTRRLDVEAGGVTSTATLYERARRPSNRLLVFLPAMGAPATFYRPLAEALVRLGPSVLVGEIRGVGTSSVRASHEVDFGYFEHVMVDLPALLDAAHGARPRARLLLGGHSLGGHIALAYAGIDRSTAERVVLVASSAPYHRLWPAPIGWGLLAYARVIGLVTERLGYFPGRRLGFGGTEARRFMREWAELVAHGEFVARESELVLEAAFDAVRQRVLSVSFPGDAFAPEAAIEHVLAKAPHAIVTRRAFSPSDFGGERVGHFGWMCHVDVVAAAIAPFLSGGDA